MKVATLYIEILNFCNKKCSYCYQENNTIQKTLLNFKSIKNIIDQACDYGIEHITISGGEPTLHPDFYKIVNYIINKNINIKIISNLYDYTLLKTFFNNIGKKKNLIELQCTIDGFEGNHDYYRGKNDYKIIKENLYDLNESFPDINIEIRYNIHQESYQDIEKVYNELSYLKGIFLISPIYIKNIFYPSELLDLAKLLNQKNKMLKVAMMIPPMTCSIYNKEEKMLAPSVNTLGDIYFCQTAFENNLFYLGNILKNDLNVILSIENLDNVIQNLKKLCCENKCILGRYCNGGCLGIYKNIVKDNDGFCAFRKLYFTGKLKIQQYNCWGCYFVK